MDRTKSTRFQNLLLDYSHETDLDKRGQIEESLWQEYGTEFAILVLDMSGFSLLTRKYGIVHYLSMVRRMQVTVEPIIDSFEGIVVKFEADNCFAVFPKPLAAIRDQRSDGSSATGCGYQVQTIGVIDLGDQYHCFCD